LHDAPECRVIEIGQRFGCLAPRTSSQEAAADASSSGTEMRISAFPKGRRPKKQPGSEMMATQERRTSILETGDIFFLFRPRVGQDQPADASDVQRFYIVLHPEAEAKFRLLVVGRKRQPDIGEHERTWGFVALVEDSADAIERELREEVYETKTRGEQRQPAARPAGEGVYAIPLEDGQMHLCYVLELPEKPSEVQKALHIEPEASFALSVKNPEKGGPPGAGLRASEKPDYPEELQKQFRGRRFAREDIRMLDFPGAEFIMVGARTDPQREYGVELETEKEDYKHAEIIRELRMEKSRHPVKPLFEGRWQ
jgi:hypothetical protein